jgi:hypothetical protein
MKHFKYYFVELMLLIFGLFICTFIFYIRIILDRIPHEIDFSWNIYKFIVFFFLTVIILFLLKKKIFSKQKTNRFIEWINKNLLIKIITLYDSSLKKVYFHFIEWQNNIIKDFLQYCIFNLANFLELEIIRKHAYSSLIIYYFFVIIPRIIVLHCFLVDVIIFQKFYYMYKTIWLLIIPLIWNIIYYIIKEHANTQFLGFNLYLNIEIINNKDLLSKYYNSDAHEMIIITINENSSYAKEHPISKKEYQEFIQLVPKFLTVLRYYVYRFSEDSNIFYTYIYYYTQIYIYLIYFTIFTYFLIRIAMNY